MAQERSTAFYLLAGCACIAVLGIAVLAVGSWFTVRAVRNVTAQFDDPAVAAERSAAILGAETLPPGFAGRFGISIPFVGKMAMLDGPLLEPDSPDAEHEPPEPARASSGSAESPESTAVEPGRWVFFYMDFPAGKNSDDAMTLDTSEEEIIDLLEQRGIRVERGALVDRGNFEVGGQVVQYLTGTGRIWNSGRAHHGAMSLLTVSCPGEDADRDRIGMLMAGDPQMVEGDPFDPQGTPAEPAALQRMFGHFRLCPDARRD